MGGGQLRPNIHIKDMIKAYMLVINTESSKINFQTFNAGNNNMSVLKIAETVRDQFEVNIPIEILETNDNRSYHINSDKAKKILDYTPRLTVEDAVLELCNCFKKNMFVNSLDDKKYFNVKRLKELNAK